VNLSPQESEFYEKFLELKKQSGNHSPSIFKLLKCFSEVTIKVDACFLCNPYAFEIFYNELLKKDLEKYIKFYPPQNQEVAENLSLFSNVPASRILVGNGAIQLIETILGEMGGRKVLLPIPTFSTYYEAIPDCKDIIPYQLNPRNDYAVDIEDFINVVRGRKPDCVVLVNPNNPTGQLLDKKSIIRIHHELTADQLLIVDESFIDFSSQDDSLEEYSLDYSNIIIIRSLSKDFGIAGLRVGYAVMSEERIKTYLQRGFLWNSNGLAYFFTELLADEKFRNKYQKARDDYNSARDAFYQELVSIGIDVTASQANFFMIKVADPELYFTKLLYTHGIYTRILNDKWGLDGGYLRIASKDRKENRMMINAIKKILNRDK